MDIEKQGERTFEFHTMLIFISLFNYSSGNLSYNYTSVSGDGEEGGGELRLTGLRPYSRYSLVVQAYNQVGPGPLSEALTAQTLEDGKNVVGNDEGSLLTVYVLLVPTMPPDDVRCAALTSQSLQVSWQPPLNTHTNGIIQGYKLNYEPISADPWRGVDDIEVGELFC